MATIYWIDGSADTIADVMALVQEAGHTVRIIHNGAAALAQTAQIAAADLIVFEPFTPAPGTPFALNRFPMLGVLSALRAAGVETPALIFTTFRHRFVSGNGIVDVVDKPIHPLALLAAVTQALAHSTPTRSA